MILEKGETKESKNIPMKVEGKQSSASKKDGEADDGELEVKLKELMKSNAMTYNKLQMRTTELAFTEKLLADAKMEIDELMGENRRLKEYLNDSATRTKANKWPKNPFKRHKF